MASSKHMTALAVLMLEVTWIIKLHGCCMPSRRRLHRMAWRAAMRPQQRTCALRLHHSAARIQQPASNNLRSINACTTGLDELVRKDPRYATLREALFSRAAASLARDQLTADAVAKLDAAVAEFCGLLSQHFLAPGAFKALEYLIRRFRWGARSYCTAFLH